VPVNSYRDARWVAACSRVFLIGMVTRCFEPGCIMRISLVLEGEQAAGKTTWVKSLAPYRTFYTSISLEEIKNENEFNKKIKSKSIVEFEEMVGKQQADVNLQKKILSSQWIDFREHYEKHQQIQRSNIFVFTTNEMGDYLRDQTGNTRFAPVRLDLDPTKGQFVDQESFDHNYFQMLAQAIYMYRMGLKPFFTEEETAIQISLTQDRELITIEAEWVEDYMNGVIEGDQTRLQWCMENGVRADEIVTWINERYFPPIDIHRYGRSINNGLKRFGFHPYHTSVHVKGSDQVKQRRWLHKDDVRRKSKKA
jgi:predicted P-loop ATPase